MSCLIGNDFELFVYFAEMGLIKKSSFKDYLDYALNNDLVQFTAYLLEKEKKNFSYNEETISVPNGIRFFKQDIISPDYLEISKYDVTNRYL